MARGKRPVTFRTRKLSLSAPMVLPWRRGGRVGRRRTYFLKWGSEHSLRPPFWFVRHISMARSRRMRPRPMRYPDVMTAPRRGSGGSPSRRGGPQSGGSRSSARGGSGGSGGGARGGTPRGGTPRGGSAGRAEPRAGRPAGTDRNRSADRPQRPSGGFRGRPEGGSEQ